jgi:L-fuconolactonase
VRIDAHQHFWLYDAREYDWIEEGMEALRRDFLPPDLRPLLARAGFDGCVAVQARQSLEETRFLLDLAEANDFVLGVVGWVDLLSGRAAAQLDAFRGRQKLVGVRHVVQSEPDDRFLLREAFGRGLAAVQERGLAYDLLLHPRHLKPAAELAARFPGLRFVLDHAGKPRIARRELAEWARDLKTLARRSNVLCKLSGLVTEADWKSWSASEVRPYLDVAFGEFGAERLMIGSDWPVCTLAADYGGAMGLVVDYLSRRPEAETAAVCGGNARRFWRLAGEEAKP